MGKIRKSAQLTVLLSTALWKDSTPEDLGFWLPHQEPDENHGIYGVKLYNSFFSSTSMVRSQNAKHKAEIQLSSQLFIAVNLKEPPVSPQSVKQVTAGSLYFFDYNQEKRTISGQINPRNVKKNLKSHMQKAFNTKAPSAETAKLWVGVDADSKDASETLPNQNVRRVRLPDFI